MSREEIHKLVGGYATGTLTQEEREALFQAALEDQELFDVLAREEALREVLSDPASKAQVLAALDEKPLRWYEHMGWLRPAGAALAMAGLAAFGVIAFRQNMVPRFPPASASQVAEDKAATPPVTPAPMARAPEGTAVSGVPTTPERAPLALAAPRPAADGVASGSLAPKEKLAESAPMTQPMQPASTNAAPRFAAGSGGPGLLAGRAESAAASGALPSPPPAPAAAAPPLPPARTLAGTVTDSAGAVVREATVTVASESRTMEKQAKTDAQGNWSLEIPRPGQYQVTVDAPGFQTGRAGVEVLSADNKLVNVQLNPGAASQTVEVTAGAAVVTQFQQSQQSTLLSGGSLGGFGGGAGPRSLPLSARQIYEVAATQPAARTAPATSVAGVLRIRDEAGPVGLRYSLLPKDAGGAVVIQFTATADGYLTVTTQAGAALVLARVERLKPFVTPPLPPGEKQIVATYSRQAPTAVSKPAAKDLMEVKAAPAQQASPPPAQETVAGVTYVAARSSQGPLSFRIDLK